MDSKRMRVWALYRVSTVKQLDDNDIPMQQLACREFAKEKGWDITHELYEKGISGFKKAASERDAIAELRAGALSKQYDVLLVFMFDRLGRRQEETPFIVRWFVENGIKVWSTKEGEQVFENHSDSLLNFMRFWAAEGESLKTSDRTRTRLEQLTREGRYTGGGTPFGYKLVETGRINKRNKPVFDLAVDENSAAIVRLIFNKYVFEGMGAQAISHWLDDSGIKKADGTNFPNTSIVRLLKNAIYCGYLHNGKAVSEFQPALQIVDKEIFDRTQEIMQSRRQKRHDVPLNCRGSSLLVGKVYCGHCGGILCLTTSGGRVRKDGSRGPARVRYNCYYKVRHKFECDGQSGYGRDKLDKIVDQLIRLKFEQIKAMGTASIGRTKIGKERQLITSQLSVRRKEIDSKRKEIEDYRKETIRVIRGKSTFSAELLSDCINTAEAELVQLEANYSVLQSNLEGLTGRLAEIEKECNRITSWSDLYDNCPIGTKKMIIAQLIDSIHVYRDYELDVKFNISFEDVLKYTAEVKQNLCGEG